MTTVIERPVRQSNNKLPARAEKHLSREVQFVLECPGAKEVYICGDFNGWRPTSLRMLRREDAGIWEKRLALSPGRYEYKFHVDGRWLHDAGALENIPNAHGSLNSVVEV
jgi:1,4-alpha-glucan branching enzyme